MMMKSESFFQNEQPQFKTEKPKPAACQDA